MSYERVLSVDWDYFIGTSAIRRNRLFPDGGNEEIGYSANNMVWAIRYAESIIKQEHIERIAVRKEYTLLKDFLKRLPKSTNVYVADSHKYAYNFCRTCNGKIDLVNIDFHPDICDRSNEVDCGNWITTLIQENRINCIAWVKRTDSCTFGIDRIGNLIITNNIKDVLADTYSKVFLCRSGVWSPPHLDSKFRRVYEEALQDKRVYVNAADIVQWDRYNEIKPAISQLAASFKPFIGGYHG